MTDVPRENQVYRRRAGPASYASSDSTPGREDYDRTGLSHDYHQPGAPIGFFSARGTPYQKKFMSKRLMIATLVILPILFIVQLVVLLLPVLWAIARHALSTSVMHIYASNITQPGNESFPISLEGQVKKAGVFPAKLYFRKPVQVYWNTPPPEMREVLLGEMSLERIGIAANHGRIKQLTKFHIKDKDGFQKFSEYLVGTEEFTWRLKCDQTHIQALNFIPTFENLNLVKDITLKGLHNFEDAKIIDFQLPGADPQGGVTTVVTTYLRNPSPFGFQIGTLNLALYAEGVYLGPVSTENLNIVPGANIVTVHGRLIPYFDNPDVLNKLGDIFTHYINSEPLPAFARGTGMVPYGGGAPTFWLNAAVKKLNIQIPLLPPVPINPIKAIVIKEFNLTYPPGGNAYSPEASSDSLSAQIGLPFGFPLNITGAQNSITIFDITGTQAIAQVDGVMSKGSTELQVLQSGQTAGELYLTLKPSPMNIVNQTDEAKKQFQLFQKEFTFVGPDPKKFRGESKALTDTPLGRIMLNGIKFDVDSGLLGLQGLTKEPTTITGVDVVGGTRAGLQLLVNTTMINPSNVNLAVGDVTLLLVNHDVVGDVLLPNMNLVIGENNLTAKSTVDPNSSPYGLDMLNQFVGGVPTPLNISGTPSSTKIDSLVPAFEAIRVNTTLPPLGMNLVQDTALKVLPTTGVTNDVANVIVSLNNPFTVDLQISHIRSNATSHGIFVATIDTPLNFTGKGKSVSQSPQFPLHMNLFPPDIFGLLRALAVDAGEETRQLDGILKIGGYTPTKTTDANTPKSKRSMPEERTVVKSVVHEAEANTTGPALQKRKENMYTNFNLPDYVHKAFSKALMNLVVESESTMGEYTTTITFPQQDVSLKTDQTLDLLLPVLARPVVQKIVDGSVLAVQSVLIINPQAKSFQARLKGTIRHSGPFDATISFDRGLQVSWSGRTLGQLRMPPVNIKADEGGDIDVMTDFSISDVDALTDFTKFMVTQKSFLWTIQGEGLSVRALGINVTDITIYKNVILTGLNGLKNDITITNYTLPSNDPEGGIHLTAQTQIVSPAQVGVQLSRFGTTVWRNGTNLGPSYAQHPFTLYPLSQTNLPLAGRLVHQDPGHGLETLSQTFTDVVHGEEIPVDVHGEYAGPEDVKWLNEGIKALKVKTKLPAKHFSVIKGISLNQLSLFFTKQKPWAPTASTTDTTAPFFLPFDFPIDIKRVGGQFIENYKNKDIAELDVPWSPAETDVQNRIIKMQFSDVPMEARKNQHSAFSGFIADTTRQKSITFQLHGEANSRASTAAGYVTITAIPFGVSTSLLGLQNLNARPANVSDLDVKHGYPSYLLITVNAWLYNPSHITIGTQDVNFDLHFEGHTIGQAFIKGLVLKPGVNKVPTDVHYSPQGKGNTAVGQKMLENYVQGIQSETIIAGTMHSTPIDSLKQALAGIRLQTMIPPLHQLLIVEARLVIPTNIAQTGKAQSTFQLDNPFTASINLLKVNAKVYYKSHYLGVIDQNLKPPIRAPGHTKITSRSLPLDMDIDPKNLIPFIEERAADTNTDLGPLPGQFSKVMAMKSTKNTVKPVPDPHPPNCHSGQQFDVFGAILHLLQGLKVLLDIKSTDKLDDYKTDLNFKQKDVPVDTDRTSLYLIGPVGAPIVQNIVDGAKLSFSMANITRVTNEGFDVALQGQLLNAGPFDAQIEFPDGVIVNWEGNDIAKIHLPPVCSAANVGVPNYRTKGHLKITDKAKFTAFTTYILHNPTFSWTIHSDHLRVRSLNIVFSDVKISKKLDFKAFNNLRGSRILDFKAQGQTSNAIKIYALTALPSPANLGIQLDEINVDLYYHNHIQGNAHSVNLFLAALSTTNAPLYGYLTKRTSNAQTNATGELFSRYLQGKNTTIQAKGKSVVTRANGNKEVDWMTKAIKTLTLETVLPGHIYKVLKSITISDMLATIMDRKSQWRFPIGSNQSIAVFANPLDFNLKVLKASLSAVLTYQGGEAGDLFVKMTSVQSGTSTGPSDPKSIVLGFKNAPLQAHQHDKLQALFHDLAITKGTTFGLKGTTDVVAQTVIGNIPIHGIGFQLNTYMRGLDSLTRYIEIQHSMPANATAESANIAANVVITNPSNITIKSTGLSLGSFYKNVYNGRSTLNNFAIIPGKNYMVSLLKYSPPNKNDSVALEFFQRYLQPVEHRGTAKIPYKSPIVIKGSDIPAGSYGGPITPFQVLEPAFRDTTANAVATGLAIRVLMRIDNQIDLLTAFDGPGGLPEISLYLTFYNPVAVAFEFLHVQNDSKKAGSDPVYAHFTWTPQSPGCYLPPSKAWEVNPSVTKCPKVTHVVLNRGLLGSLELIGQRIDAFNMAVSRIGGKSGYIVPAMRHNDYSVESTYALTIGDTVLLNITKAEDLIKGFLGALPKLSKQQKSHIGQGMQRLGQGGIQELVGRGLKDFVCALEDLPFSLIHTAGCKQATQSNSTSSSGTPSSTGAQSSGGQSHSSGSNAPSSSAGGQGQPSGGSGGSKAQQSGGGSKAQQSGGGSEAQRSGGSEAQQSGGGQGQGKQTGGGGGGGNSPQSKRGVKVAPGSQGVKVKASPQSTRR